MKALGKSVIRLSKISTNIKYYIMKNLLFILGLLSIGFFATSCGSAEAECCGPDGECCSEEHDHGEEEAAE